jgi:uncharacterized protein YcfJ
MARDILVKRSCKGSSRAARAVEGAALGAIVGLFAGGLIGGLVFAGGSSKKTAILVGLGVMGAATAGESVLTALPPEC